MKYIAAIDKDDDSRPPPHTCKVQGMGRHVNRKNPHIIHGHSNALGGGGIHTQKLVNKTKKKKARINMHDR